MSKNNLPQKRSVSRGDDIKKAKRLIITLAAVFVLSVLLFGAVIGVMAAVKDASALVKYGGVTADEGVTSYLASTFKNSYMKENGAKNTPEYWSEEYNGKTRGEYLKDATLEYIKSVLVGAYLFDRYSSLTQSERRGIETATGEVLDMKAGGSVDSFNEAASVYGFDYDDFCTATELLYKASRAMYAIYGEGGARLKNLGDTDIMALSNLYFSTFSRVKLLYIDTRMTVERDSEGNLAVGDDNYYITRFLSPDERVARQKDISAIRTLIENIGDQTDDEMSPEYFDLMQEKYNYSEEYNASGYYFSLYSEFTAKFANASTEMIMGEYGIAFNKMLSAAVELSFTMSDGEYREIEGDYGSLFIYKCTKEDGAFLSSSYAKFFHDFYQDAALYLYSESVEALMEDVEVRENYAKIDIINLPYNYIFKAEING